MPARERYHHGALRTALIEAGVEIAERDGISALSTRAAAREVGVSHGAPARHFADGESFLAAVAAEGYRRLSASLAHASSTASDELAAFRAAGAAYVAFADEHPELFRLLFHPLLSDKAAHPELLQASTAAFTPLLDAITTAQAAGSVRSGDPRELALAAWAAVHGLAVLVVDAQLPAKGYGAATEALISSVTETLHLGLRPAGPRA